MNSKSLEFILGFFCWVTNLSLVDREEYMKKVGDSMKTTDFLVTCLENEGNKHVFGICWKGDSSIQFIVVRHEQSAAFMAYVYGQLTVMYPFVKT
jgi:hypothetical protein